MSFFGKFKPAFGPTQLGAATQQKKDPNAPIPTPLEKHLANITGPVREDGSDKYFGFENYGSTCYANSIIQCLYYSEPFREHVISFPSQTLIDGLAGENPTEDEVAPPPSPNATPYPNVASPARKQQIPVSPGPGGIKVEENKDSPEFKKKTALAVGPVLEMTQNGSKRYQMDESLFTSLRDIFEAIIKHESRIGIVSPHRFLEILRRENEMFRSAMHQDAHEFLNLLLNQVVDNVEMFSKQHPDLPKANGRLPEQSLVKISQEVTSKAGITNGLDTHWVHDLFEGLLTSETRCLTCETVSQRDEAFLDLSVDLAPHTSVTSCLRKFSEEEMLCERNKFHCDNCGGLQEAEKRMKIKRLPRILALHLKRFKYTEDLQRLQKLFHKVVYPFHLRLFNTTDDAEDPDRLYELYAVVVHIGGGPYHGHYVSIIKTQDRGWLLFDDELVEPVDKSFVLSFFGGEPVPGAMDAKQLACAYVLFYQETTLEAMIKEQEVEGQGYANTQAAETEPVKEAGASPMKNGNGLHHTVSIATPNAEEGDQMENLAHISSIAAVTSPARPELPRSPTAIPYVDPVMIPKTKKELKAEQKSEEKERKAREKAELKALEQKRRELSEKRIAAWRKQDEELKRAVEESKASASTEDKHRRTNGGEETHSMPSTAVQSNPLVKEGGLARFRNGSMSLRSKPRLFGKDKDKPAASDTATTMPLARSATTTTRTLNGVHELDNTSSSSHSTAFIDRPLLHHANGEDPASHAHSAYVTSPASTTTAPSSSSSHHSPPPQALPPLPPIPPPAVVEEKKSRNRFSLGRKKSANLLG